MQSILISICIPLFNGEKYIQQCLDSAIKQTYTNIEIVLIDDASTDSTGDIASKYADKDKRIKLYRNEKNIGLAGNFNKCIEHATGQWIKFLLQDDYLTVDCIETMVKSISAKDKMITCKRTFLLYDKIDEKKRKYYQHEVVTFEKLGVVSKEPVTIGPKQVAVMASGNICLNFIGEPTSIMFKKDIVTELGYFNTDLAQICDLEYFLRIGSKYGIKYIPAALTYFRIHLESTTEANLQAKKYTLSHIDPIITVHQLLFDKSYTQFRSNLSFIKKVKLKLYFLVRLHESFISAGIDKSAADKFNNAAGKYTEIMKHKEGSFFVKIVLALIKARRKTRN